MLVGIFLVYIRRSNANSDSVRNKTDSLRNKTERTLHSIKNVAKEFESMVSDLGAFSCAKSCRRSEEFDPENHFDEEKTIKKEKKHKSGKSLDFKEKLLEQDEF